MDNTIYAVHNQPYPEIGTPTTPAQKAEVEKLVAAVQYQEAADLLNQLRRAHPPLSYDPWYNQVLLGPLGYFILNGWKG